jgi:co-chaperonin GroES (HSP10)
MKIDSLYLKRFQNLDDTRSIHFLLKGNLILVEKLPEPEKRTKGGIILPSDNSHRQLNSIGADAPNFCVVLQVGEGYYNDNGVLIEDSMDVKVGDIVLLPKLSIKYFSIFADLEDYKPDTIGIAKETEIQMIFNQVEGYYEYFRQLNN